MRAFRLEVGALAANCYLVLDEVTGHAAIIDPGGDPDRIIRRCERAEGNPLYIINTHGHCDHMAANALLKERYPQAKLCIGKRDAALLTAPLLNLSGAFGQPIRSPEADLLLSEGDRLRVGSLALEVLETPGHTAGSISLLLLEGQGPVLFCGDLIFSGGVGRTDLDGGDFAELKDSIERKVFALPEQTRIMPGHGPETTVGREKRSNPFVGAGTFC